MAWAFVLAFALPDYPGNAWFLSKEDRILAVKRVSQNDTGIKSKVWRWPQFWAAL